MLHRGTQDIARDTNAGKGEVRGGGDILDYKEMMVNQARSQGKSSLLAYTLGVITSIVECNYAPVDKANGISLALEAMLEVLGDSPLPRDYADVKKAPAPTEAEEEIAHPDCIVNVTKVQSLLEPWYLERILREKGNEK